MERLTSNKDKSEMSMVELAHNSCYAKDGKARYRDYGRDTDARLLARKLMIYFTEEDISYARDEDFDEHMADRAALGCDCVGDLVALFYRNMWAMADLHAHLKHLEDLQEQGRLLELPCAVGDVVYQHMTVGVDKGRRKAVYEVCEAKVFKFSLDSYTLCIWTETVDEKKYQNEVPLSAFGKTLFLTREEAEKALKRMEDGNGQMQ